MNISESNFEDAIEYDLIQVGYKKENASNYDTKHGLFVTQLLDFILSSQKSTWDKLTNLVGEYAKDIFVERLEKDIKARGLIDVIRRGFVVRGFDFKLAYFKPNTKLNAEAEKLYQQNILTVIRQVYFSSKNNKSLDMVLTLNGFPIITMELKNPMTGQTVENAKEQYRKTRDPKELIFQFNTRSLVHFALDTNEVYMTTKLDKEKTFFLPFNKGNNYGAGNPPAQVGEYKTTYLWKEILTPDSLLDIVNRYIHKEGNKLIFPRYHQLDVVRQLISDTEQRGAGTNYLIQHSAGSGKSNSIAWLAHRLSSLHDGTDSPVFDSIIVITDRKALDRQLKNTIYQFERNKGVVEWAEHSSSDLARFLENGTKIIITTLQKFPFALKKIGELENRKYAVIVDEAHSSQSGEAANSVRETLADRDDYFDSYDQIEATIQQRLKAQGKQDNLSFFAFTATPKKSTLEMFGTREKLEATPEPFHIYSMKQAIEEKFIHDVLGNYTEYTVYYNVYKKIADDPEVDKRKAAREIAHFVASHPKTINEKTRIIVEHFNTSIKHRINGKAKAMVVTASRKQAVLYKLAFDKYLFEKGLRDIKCLVAFSGSVKLEHDEVEYTEAKLNGFSESELPERFASDDYQILIVANKYQTGFDQPLLHTMYVDKRLRDINCVQTLSRLNRTTNGKRDTFILDFANTIEEIEKSFQPYYQMTSIDKNTDPDSIYDLVRILDDSMIYYKDEIDAFSNIYFSETELEKHQHAKIEKIVQQSSNRYFGLEEENQIVFKATLSKYLNTYNYLTQLIPFENEYFLKLFAFGKRLYNILATPYGPIVSLDIERKVDLAHLNIVKTAENIKGQLENENGKVGGDIEINVKNVEDELSTLSSIIEMINTLFGEELTEEGFGGFIHQVIEDGVQDESLTAKALSNNFDVFANTAFDEGAFMRLFSKRAEMNMDMIQKVIGNKDLADLVKDYIALEIYKNSRK